MTQELQERLDRYTDKSGDCWLWTGSTRKGYGRVCVHRKAVSAHRLAYELQNGPIPKGQLVCHTCDNPLCVRPSHLFLGSSYDNTRDMINKGRNARGERSATAKLDEHAVRSIRNLYKNGWKAQWIADMYGMSHPMIVAVVRRDNWAHVEGEW